MFPHVPLHKMPASSLPTGIPLIFPTIISILINVLKTSSDNCFPNGSLLLSSLVVFIIAFIRRVSLIDLHKPLK